MRKIVVTIAVAALCLVALPSFSAPSLSLPLTLEQIWYRTEKKRGIVGAKSRGDLTITEDSLDYSARKESFSLPLDTIHGIFLGKMQGDVDTDWILLRVGSSESPKLIGFRDGRRMGYGQRTLDIYKTLRTAMRQLNTAQYRTPEGYAIYDRSGSEFTIAIPEEWSGLRRSREQTGGGPSLGTTVFGVRDQIQDGKVVILQRRAISTRLSCNSLGDKGSRIVSEWVQSDLAQRDVELQSPLEINATRMTFCNGVRIKGQFKQSDGLSRIIEYRVIAKRGVAYMLSFEADRDLYDEHLLQFEKIVSTFQISPTR